MVSELIGFCEISTEDLIDLQDKMGQEIYLFFEDSVSRNAILKLRTLFIPSSGTIDRFGLNLNKVSFKNSQQFLFYKVLSQRFMLDDYGYEVPVGKYMPN